jgi:hypothetical protein
MTLSQGAPARAAAPWPTQANAALNAFYGNPDSDGNGVPDRTWEDANLVSIAPPYRMVLAWAPETAVKTIRVHKLAAASLQRALGAILAHYGNQAAIEAARMHLYGGCYAFRPMRGAARLSVHSWGCAIDLDPARNSLGAKPRIDPAVVSIFAAEGWTWGGGWSRPDGMHFQAASV